VRPGSQSPFRILAGALLALIFAWSPLGGASPLFEDDEVIELTLTGPFGSLLETKQNPVYLPFRLETVETSLPVEIRVRGHSRLRVCDFPPLRLKLPPGPGDRGVEAGADPRLGSTPARLPGP
jgi:hypothetical protein